MHICFTQYMILWMYKYIEFRSRNFFTRRNYSVSCLMVISLLRTELFSLLSHGDQSITDGIVQSPVSWSSVYHGRNYSVSCLMVISLSRTELFSLLSHGHQSITDGIVQSPVSWSSVYRGWNCSVLCLMVISLSRTKLQTMVTVILSITVFCANSKSVILTLPWRIYPLLHVHYKPFMPYPLKLKSNLLWSDIWEIIPFFHLVSCISVCALSNTHVCTAFFVDFPLCIALFDVSQTKWICCLGDGIGIWICSHLWLSSTLVWINFTIL